MKTAINRKSVAGKGPSITRPRYSSVPASFDAARRGFGRGRMRDAVYGDTGESMFVLSEPHEAEEIAAERAADAVMATPGDVDAGDSLAAPRVGTVAHTPLRTTLALRHSAGDGGLLTAPLGAAIKARRGNGLALPLGERDFFERRFGADFGNVGYHTDDVSRRLTRAVGARAFTVGDDVFFGEGAWRPGSFEGRRLLAHELTHVIQQQGDTGSPMRIQRQDSGEIEPEISGRDVVAMELEETLLELIAEKESFVPRGLVKSILAEPTYNKDFSTSFEMAVDELVKSIDSLGPSSAVMAPGELVHLEVQSEHRKAGTSLLDLLHEKFSHLEDELRRVKELSVSWKLSPHDSLPGSSLTTVVGMLLEMTYSAALDDQENLYIISQAVADNFPPEVVKGFLDAAIQNVSSATPQRDIVDMLAPQSGHPWSQVYGPNVFGPFAMTGMMAHGLENTAEIVQTNVQAFAEGLLEGLADNVDDATLKELEAKLTGSLALTLVFPLVFSSGAAVGILKDAYDTIASLWDIDEALESVDALGKLMFSADGEELARAMGQDMGEAYAKDIAALANEDIIDFTYELGRLAGPTIVYTILSFMGLPEVAAMAVFTRVKALLGKLKKLKTRIGKYMERLKRRSKDSGKGGNKGGGNRNRLDIPANSGIDEALASVDNLTDRERELNFGRPSTEELLELELWELKNEIHIEAGAECVAGYCIRGPEKLLPLLEERKIAGARPMRLVEAEGGTHIVTIGKTSDGRYYMFDPTIEQFTTKPKVYPEPGATTRNDALVQAYEGETAHFVKDLHGEAGLAMFDSGEDLGQAMEWLRRNLAQDTERSAWEALPKEDLVLHSQPE